VAALKRVSFALGENEIVGLIGPNGAGKTTLFNCLSGFQVPDEGGMLFGGCAARDARTGSDRGPGPRPHLSDEPRLQAHDGARARPHRPLPSSASRAVGRPSPGPAGSATRSRAARARGLATLGLFEDRLLPRIDDFADSLSYANRRRLEIARALVSEPRLLLLDEPTAGMNPHETAGIVTLIQAIRAMGITVFLIEHDMKVIMNASDRIIVLDHGEKIAEGRPEEIRVDEDVIQAYMGRRGARA
jgi:ABC-type branched-subunit amino acid transport system ATPase component